MPAIAFRHTITSLNNYDNNIILLVYAHIYIRLTAQEQKNMRY